MPPLIGPLHVVLVVLIITGSLKLIRPAAASKAIVTANLIPLGWRQYRLLVGRLVGLVEVVVGLGALVVASPPWLLAGAGLYLGFDLFLWRLERVASGADCGCGGTTSQPASATHYGANIVAASICILGVVANRVRGPVGMAQVNDLGALMALCYWVLVLVLSWLIAFGPGLVGAVDPKRVIAV